MRSLVTLLCGAAALLPLTDIVGQEIRYPVHSVVDDPRPIVVDGLSAGARVTLQTYVLDATGMPWRAQADFTADSSGSVDTGRDAPTGGSYSGVQAAALFNQMVPESGQPLRFSSAGLTALRTSVMLVGKSGVLDSITTDRALWDPEVTIREVTDRGFAARLGSGEAGSKPEGRLPETLGLRPMLGRASWPSCAWPGTEHVALGRDFMTRNICWRSVHEGCALRLR